MITELLVRLMTEEVTELCCSTKRVEQQTGQVTKLLSGLQAGLMAKLQARLQAVL